MDARTATAAPRSAAPDQIAEPSAPTRGRRLARRHLFILLAALVALGAVAFALEWLLVGSHHVTTDDAYVDADVADVTPQVSGPVLAAPATDTLPVRRGDVLVVIDPADFKLALAQAQAALGQAERRVQGYFASRDANAALTQAKVADLARAKAQLASAQSDFERARTDLARRQALAADGAVSGDELTSAQNKFNESQAAVGAAQAAVGEAQATQLSQVGQTHVAEALVLGAGLADNPEVAAAQAKLDQAKLDLERTVIRAPIDGVIAKNAVQVGQRVQPGAQLMTVVPIQAAYVNANFKEGQLRHVRIGQAAVLTSDLYGGGVKFHGRVVGVAGGTGAAFAVIPAQNATGNWIKVVQRLPVRIALDPEELKQRPLQVGLSMNVDVDTAK
jgi:membrane fusion protein (multidrug efflux system)